MFEKFTKVLNAKKAEMRSILDGNVEADDSGKDVGSDEDVDDEPHFKMSTSPNKKAPLFSKKRRLDSGFHLYRCELIF